MKKGIFIAAGVVALAGRHGLGRPQIPGGRRTRRLRARPPNRPMLRPSP